MGGLRQDCKHWTKAGWPFAGGVCRLISSPFRVHEVPGNTKAHAMDADGLWRGQLLTSWNFGCVQFEAKEG